jgi:molybdenum cofactor cytidylyltransferase
MSFISAIITAAGKSSRMSKDQSLYNIENKNKLILSNTVNNDLCDDSDVNKTIIETTIDNVLNANIDECILVLGHHSDEIMDVLNNIKDSKLKIVYNDPVDVGLSTSLFNGIVNTKNDYVLCVAGDQPTISTKTYNNLIDNLLNSKNPDKTISILRRNDIGILNSAEGLGMPFATNKIEILKYLKDYDDNLNPLLRKIFDEGYVFYGIKEENPLELLNINNYKDYKKFINKNV